MIASLIQERRWRAVKAEEETAMAWTRWTESLSQTCQLGWTWPLPSCVPPCRQWHFTNRTLDAALSPKQSCGLCRCLLFAKLFLLSCGFESLLQQQSLPGRKPFSLCLSCIWRHCENLGAWRPLSNGELYLQNSWSISEIWPLCECVLREGKLIWNWALLEVSKKNTSLDDSAPDNRHWTICVAHTEEYLAQPSLNLPWMQHPCLIIAGASSHWRLSYPSSGWWFGWCLAM